MLAAMRFNYVKNANAGYLALLQVETFLHDSGLEQNLIHLIKLRVSQINSCAYCIDLHYKDLRALGEPEDRLYMLNAWRESALYSVRERAALLWAEAVTNLHDGNVPDEIFEEVSKHFDEVGMSNITFVIAAINAWNRLAISGRAMPGKYKSQLKPSVGTP
jgi:AhpD family alkylhydroperoxidase